LAKIKIFHFIDILFTLHNARHLIRNANRHSSNDHFYRKDKKDRNTF